MHSESMIVRHVVYINSRATVALHMSAVNIVLLNNQLRQTTVTNHAVSAGRSNTCHSSPVANAHPVLIIAWPLQRSPLRRDLDLCRPDMEMRQRASYVSRDARNAPRPSHVATTTLTSSA